MRRQERSLTEVLVITGMSGAGRSTAGNVLEDLGWYVVDNLPAALIPSLVQRLSAEQVVAEAEGASSPLSQVAVAVDVRGGTFFEPLLEALDELDRAGHSHRLLYLDASDEALVRRFESVRRPHPLQGSGRLLDAIQREREQLAVLRSRADTLIDTSHLNVHQLSTKVAQIFTGQQANALRLTVMSFGFKNGLPLDADHVADVRFLPNPYWIPELRSHNGLDVPVSEYVLSQPGAQEFLKLYHESLKPVLSGYLRENKRYATIAIGCTGGQHRSVAMTEALATLLRDEDVEVTTVHRDLGNE